VADEADPAGPREEEPLEASVKGIAQGVVGKLKEVAGELLEDEKLEQKGIAEQRESEIRRAKT